MTGIVLWDDSGHQKTNAIQLEFSYMRYSDVVSQAGVYDWTLVDKKLEAIAKRGHQGIFRFYYVYPGKQSAGLDTWFPDWTNVELKRFTKEFYTRFAERYEKDKRLAFLQTGFGLWAEYHIYDGPLQLGKTFPDKVYQTEFLKHMGATFKQLPWSISVDAADDELTPVAGNEALLGLRFGVFDDSFLNKRHAKENEPNWDDLRRNRFKRAPAGGEFSYYTDRDQKLALAPDGPYGISFEQAARKFHISYMIGSDQPEYQPMSRIKEAGMAWLQVPRDEVPFGEGEIAGDRPECRHRAHLPGRLRGRGRGEIKSFPEAPGAGQVGDGGHSAWREEAGADHRQRPSGVRAGDPV